METDLDTLGKNLVTLGKAWRQRWLAVGRAEGRAEGKAEDLVCLLVERFGALAPPLRTRIRRARLATLERWFKRAIVAPDLPSVFNPPRREMKMTTNLATLGETWKQQALAEGWAEGWAEGKAEDLVYLLVDRFGTLPPSLRTRIRRARAATLERWFKRAIAAPDLSAVFNRQG